mgnify:CR=1 FL=1
MDRTRIIICILCLWAQFSHGQTNVFGKTIWEWGKSPSSRWGASQLVLSLHLEGVNWRGLNPFHLSSFNRTTTNTNVVRIERIGQTLNVSLDGTQRWTATTNLISRFKSAVFAAQEAGSNNIIDNF